jgi:hypothetical protein
MRIAPLDAFRLQFLVGATWKAAPEVCLHAVSLLGYGDAPLLFWMRPL